MRTFFCLPVPRLRPYIERLWGWEADEGESISLPMVLPGTGAELFFHYGTPFRQVEGQRSFALDNAHLLCVRHRPITLAETTGLGFVAVRFRAGALHHFTQSGIGELLDRQPRPADLWGVAGQSLSERIFGARCNRQRVAFLQEFLLDQLRESTSHNLINTAAGRLYRDCDAISIDTLAKQLGIGRRQLERRFQQMTGQTPVEMRRFSRFQKTVRTMLLDASSSSADAALSQGYYDQSHFIREFQTLASMSPTVYLKQARLKANFYNRPLGSVMSSC